MSNNAPEIRFKGFTDAWVQRKLGEVVCFRDGERKPLELGERNGRKGIYPYYGASGIIDYIDDYIFDEPLILLGEDGANILNRSTPLAFIATGKYWANNHAHVLNPLPEHDIQYVCEALERINYTVYNTGTAQPKLNQEVCQKIPLFLPCKTEQTRIGNFFRTLGDTITLYKRKLDGLKELKKSYLQQMFPQAGELVPRVRFAGFGEPWEQRKLGEVAIKSGQKNNTGEIFPAYSVSNQVGFIPQNEQFEESRLDNLDKSAYKIVRPNEFAYNPARVNVGSIAFSSLNTPIIISSLYVIVKMTELVDNEFVLQYIMSSKFIAEVKKNTEGTVREYLFYENFSNINFPFATDKIEQTAIGNFFKNLGEQILTQQDKLDKLKKLKAAYLQKMFI